MTPDNITLTRPQKTELKKLFNKAFNEAANFNGSEPSEEKLIESLIAVDEFVEKVSQKKPSDDLVSAFAAAAGVPKNRPHTVSALLDKATEFYNRIEENAQDYDSIFAMLKKGGALIVEAPDDTPNPVYVLTDERPMPESGEGEGNNKREIKTQPRLAKLVRYSRYSAKFDFYRSIKTNDSLGILLKS